MTKLLCGTTLRVFGKRFDARAFIKRHAIRADHVWNHGEPPVPELPPLDHGGFTIRVSDACNADEQMRDAAKFFCRHRQKLSRVKGLRDVEELWMEVVFPMNAGSRVTAFRVPPLVINEASELGITMFIIAVPRRQSRTPSADDGA